MHRGGEAIQLHTRSVHCVCTHKHPSDTSVLFIALISCDGHRRDPPEYLSVFVAILDYLLLQSHLEPLYRKNTIK